MKVSIIYRSSLPPVVITCLFSILLVGIARFDRYQQTLSQISSPWSPYTRLADWQRQQRCQARLCGALRRWRCHVLSRKGERVEKRKCQVRGWNGGDGSGHMKVDLFGVFTTSFVFIIFRIFGATGFPRSFGFEYRWSWAFATVSDAIHVSGAGALG